MTLVVATDAINNYSTERFESTIFNDKSYSVQESLSHTKRLNSITTHLMLRGVTAIVDEYHQTQSDRNPTISINPGEFSQSQANIPMIPSVEQNQSQTIRQSGPSFVYRENMAGRRDIKFKSMIMALDVAGHHRSGVHTTPTSSESNTLKLRKQSSYYSTINDEDERSEE